ncbi:MAG: hypothetical protein OHK0039_42130 [Bacteroidia bacterium]
MRQGLPQQDEVGHAALHVLAGIGTVCRQIEHIASLDQDICCLFAEAADREDAGLRQGLLGHMFFGAHTDRGKKDTGQLA